jgi:hypothetical protein
MIRYEYTDSHDQCCPVFQRHVNCTLECFFDIKFKDIEADGWRVIRCAVADSVDTPDHLLEWHDCKPTPSIQERVASIISRDYELLVKLGK